MSNSLKVCCYVVATMFWEVAMPLLGGCWGFLGGSDDIHLKTHFFLFLPIHIKNKLANFTVF